MNKVKLILDVAQLMLKVVQDLQCKEMCFMLLILTSLMHMANR